jgi:hypothetical protein
MKLSILALFTSLAIAVALFSGSGCTSKTGCENSQCATGNECIDNGKDVSCRLVCALNADGTGGQSTCPFNYHCVDGKRPYCAPDATKYAKSTKGQWGAPCVATGGIDTNPACDTDQNFACYAQTPSDGAAFCTQYNCGSDADCKGGWYCGTINTAPNAVQADRVVGATVTLCLPRTYCAPCKSDIDCVPSGGAREHCVSDNGGSKYCAPECNGDSQCNQEASCADNSEANTKVCTPNAGLCVGDGTFCSPCRSDADCTGGGACVTSSYSTEHFCATPNGGSCPLVDGPAGSNSCKLSANCPKNAISGGKTSCSFKGKENVCNAVDSQGNSVAGTPNSWPNIPNNFCFGEVKLDTAYVPGCWTKPR